MKKVLIIGGVAGGATCAARLRRLSEDVQITILEKGDYISYANCGLPYHIGNVIKTRDALLLQTPEAMKSKFNIDVRVKNEVLSINRDAKTVNVKELLTGREYEESYDTLVISTGSSPLRPAIPGIDSPLVKTLWTVPDTDEIRKLIAEKPVKSAAVVGGGFIGLEMAENLRHLGLEVSIIEAQNQVMAPLDYEMAQMLHENISSNGVSLFLGDGVQSFEDKGETVVINLSSGTKVEAELVILSIGVRPNSKLAGEAGITLNQRGGIIVDDFLRTNDPDIYAIGDVIQVEDFVLKEPAMIPLAGPANKQGRIAANNIMGAEEKYDGTQGTSIAKIFDLVAASTGVNEKKLIAKGMKRGSDYETLIINQNSHAGYYPGAVPMTLKVIFSADGKKIFGAQIVGCDGVDKRIDVLAAAIRLGAGVEDLKKLELAYAPPFSSAKDPVNMAGFVAENIINGIVEFSDVEKEKLSSGDEDSPVLLDVREDSELMTFSIPGAVHIPLGQMRERLDELDRSREIITFCAIGVRSYNASRILRENGFSNVKVYPGGTKFYQSSDFCVSDDSDEVDMGKPEDNSHSSAESDFSASKADVTVQLDCSAMQCPGPIMKVFETIQTMNDGDILEVNASDPGFLRDIDAWCKRTGNTLISTEKKNSSFYAYVRKSKAGSSIKDVENNLQLKSDNAALPDREGKTIIVFSGDLDKVLASFIIANGAAAMGRPVTMFFTFWGLNVLRKADKVKVKKSSVEKMFGSMLPRGSGKLKLSKMNMGGMGTAMMKKIMNDKNVDSLEELMQSAMKAGVKLVACTMSMDVMGIKKEELIDGVELGGVGSYLGDAEESNVNLFI